MIHIFLSPAATELYSEAEKHCCEQRSKYSVHDFLPCSSTDFILVSTRDLLIADHYTGAVGIEVKVEISYESSPWA